ncbi:MAG: hypothetical protein RML40_09175 [Bacteroidota bacterium]|nr:hypothetical protein [Candidatus Kapabacteria bacterium]MDW8220689.1 hypothetical protein [Bacteroidota bacterium]
MKSNNMRSTNLLLMLSGYVIFACASLTSCNDAGTSPITGLFSDGKQAQTSPYTITGEALAELQVEEFEELLSSAQSAKLAGVVDEAEIQNSPTRSTTASLKPEAEIEVIRLPNVQGNTVRDAMASARFDAALGVQAVEVSVLGTTYQFAPVPAMPRAVVNNLVNNLLSSLNISSLPRKSVFVYPPIVLSSTATSSSSLIKLNDANALARFRVTSYNLADNTLDIPGAITITLQENANVPRTQPLTVRWNMAGTFTEGIVTLRNIVDSAALAGLVGKSAKEVKDILKGFSRSITKKLNAPTNSVEVTAEELSKLQAGSAYLGISLKNKKTTNGGKAVLEAETHAGVRLRLQ